ncbi:hypothetical protein ACVWXL_006393 [Bradyrhizobium sp. GM22.5]
MDAGAEIVVAGVHGEDRRGPEQRQPDHRDHGHDLIAGRTSQQEADGDELNRRLPFRKLGHGHADTQRGKIFAQARDQDLAAQDHDGGPQRPAVNDAVGGQHQQARGDQKLVGDRIEHAAERRLLIPDPCVIAVEVIGDRSRDKNGDGDPAQPQRAVHDRLCVDAPDHDRDRGDPAVGQDVREGHRAAGRPSCRGDVHPSYQYRCSLKVNRSAPQMGCGMRRPYDRGPPFISPRLGMEILENPAGALGAHPRNLTEIGDRGPFDLLQGSEMMQQGTFA